MADTVQDGGRRKPETTVLNEPFDIRIQKATWKV
uniref:Bm13500 n=1 Tax=Brugia malayi TaxID=6279 RepID=A0A0J9XY36_BRUMA|nr:Bm13500 [Brugia malayi]